MTAAEGNSASADGGEGSSAGDASDGTDEDFPPQDVPAACQDAEGGFVGPEETLWEYASADSAALLYGYLDADGGVLAGGADQCKLLEFDPLMGPANEAMVESYEAGRVFGRRPSGEFVFVQSTDHEIHVREFLELQLVDETVLADDHTKPAPFNGRSVVLASDFSDTSFTAFGATSGSEEEGGGDELVSYWRKRYAYGNPTPVAVDFEKAPASAENVGGVHWAGDSSVISLELLDDHRVVRFGPAGGETVISNAFPSLPRLSGYEGSSALYRSRDVSGLNDYGNADLLQVLDVSEPAAPNTIWRDEYCAAQAVTAARFVGDDEVVVSTIDRGNLELIWFHRVDSESGELLGSSNFVAPAGYQLSKSLLFETGDGDVGAVLFGGEDVGGGVFEARALAILPFMAG